MRLDAADGWFLEAVIALLAAHVVRTVRWRIILAHCGVEVSNLRPLTALSAGYLINSLLPLRLGELVRAELLAYTSRSRFSTVLASVAVERAVDLAVIALVALATLPLHDQRALAYGAAAAAVLVFASAFVIHASRRARKLVWFAASVFNETLAAGILNFAYVATALLFDRHVLRSLRFWALTGAMWALYFVSLSWFARAEAIDPLDAFIDVYFSAINLASDLALDTRNLSLLTYLTLPLAMVLIYARLAWFNAFGRLRDALRSATNIERYMRVPPPALADNFHLPSAYDDFLNRRYQGGGGLLSEFEERGIEGVRLYRVFRGGSGAVTALVEFEGMLRVRKFASGAVGAKLDVQRVWLEDNRARLPLVEVLGAQQDDRYCVYDMAYIGGSYDFYEGIHTQPVAASIDLLDDVIDVMSSFHKATAGAHAEDVVVEAYLSAKAVANIAMIRDEFSDLFALRTVELNGEAFDLGKLAVLESSAWLSARLKDRRQAMIHGDLTIENIMLDPSRRGDRAWFLIDPNPVNGLQSPLIDFAKLMQSLHLGYETLHKAPLVSLRGAVLTVHQHRSHQYDAIFKHFVERLSAQLGADALKQVYLHEWINYLRLIPYQLRRSRTAGMGFFAFLCLLVREYDRRYPGELP